MNIFRNTVLLAAALAPLAFPHPALAEPAAPQAPVAATPTAVKPTPAAAEAAKKKPVSPEVSRLKAALEKLNKQKALLEAEVGVAQLEQRLALVPVNEERDKLRAELKLRQMRRAEAEAEVNAEKVRLELEINRLNLEEQARLSAKQTRLRDLENELRGIYAQSELDVVKPRFVRAMHSARAESDRILPADAVYPVDPLINGVLHISNRRIPFNGVVTDALANLVVSRLAFFNNKDTTRPIFIVIDNSPGGSVPAEERILAAMASSKAPVFVVVKQAAASCAAITTTLAQRSYCYPHSRILHHQMSAVTFGNMTMMREQMREMEAIYARVFLPVVKKLGYPDAAAFEKDMYSHASTGDWAVFGDEAVSRKWVDVVVEKMVEDGVDEIAENPPGWDALPSFAEGCIPERDESGRLRYRIPPSNHPNDALILHDPEGIFITGR